MELYYYNGYQQQYFQKRMNSGSKLYLNTIFRFVCTSRRKRFNSNETHEKGKKNTCLESSF